MSSSNSAVRDQFGNTWTFKDWVHWPIYSSIDIAPEDGVNHKVFQYTPGDRVVRTESATDRQATKLDTNMTRRGMLNQDEKFLALGFTWTLFAKQTFASGDLGAGEQPFLHPAEVNQSDAQYGPYVSNYNLARLRQHLTYKVIVGAAMKKPELEVPLKYLPSSIGPKVVLGSDSLVSFGQAGRPEPINQWRPATPVWISGSGEDSRPGNKRRFAVRIQAPCGRIPGLSQEVTLRLVLDGLRERPA